jgi:hypothetical protein
LIHNISKAECGSLFAETFASTLAETLTVDNTLGPLFAKAPKPKNDFGGGLGQELTQVMKLIRIGKDTLKNERGEGQHARHAIVCFLVAMSASLELTPATARSCRGVCHQRTRRI